MAARNKIKGQSLQFEINDLPYIADVTAVKVTADDADSDGLTFDDIMNGGESYDYTLSFTAVQSTDADSLWSFIWEHTGEEIAFSMAPNGNAEPSVSQPHFRGTVKVGKPGDIGGEASKDGSAWTFDAEWKITSGKPTKVTTGA